MMKPSLDYAINVAWCEDTIYTGANYAQVLYKAMLTNHKVM